MVHEVMFSRLHFCATDAAVSPMTVGIAPGRSLRRASVWSNLRDGLALHFITADAAEQLFYSGARRRCGGDYRPAVSDVLLHREVIQLRTAVSTVFPVAVSITVPAAQLFMLADWMHAARNALIMRIAVMVLPFVTADAVAVYAAEFFSGGITAVKAQTTFGTDILHLKALATLIAEVFLPLAVVRAGKVVRAAASFSVAAALAAAADGAVFVDAVPVHAPMLIPIVTFQADIVRAALILTALMAAVVAADPAALLAQLVLIEAYTAVLAYVIFLIGVFNAVAVFALVFIAALLTQLTVFAYLSVGAGGMPAFAEMTAVFDGLCTVFVTDAAVFIINIFKAAGSAKTAVLAQLISLAQCAVAALLAGKRLCACFTV